MIQSGQVEELSRVGFHYITAITKPQIEEGLHQLQTLSSTEIKVKNGGGCLPIPTPHAACRALLDALDIHLPRMLPHSEVRVDTRRKLPERRKTS